MLKAMYRTDSIIKLPLQYSASVKGSFAYVTIKDRLPVILVKVVDTLCQDKNSIGCKHGEAGKEEIKMIIGRLSALQNEMVTNKPIKYLQCDDADISLWNTYLDKQNAENEFPAAWFNSAWLYVECYLYRRIKEAFELSSLLAYYDPFYKQKQESLTNSMCDIEKLSNILHKAVCTLQDFADPSDVYNLFVSFIEISLWGNKCDLSISAGKTIISSSMEVEELKSKILVNDTERTWNVLQEARKNSNEVHLHLVLDNAGFELFCDFCFLHFLHAAKLVNRVSLYVKRIPWFVSDTIEKDIQWVLKTLLNSNQNILRDFSTQWSSNLTSGLWTIENEIFWTLPHDYSEMLSVDPKLYTKLSQGDLIIFKGDLNYRKLTGDREWNEDTPFATALNKFLPASLITLRTIKCDVIVGLQSGTTEKINNMSKNWKTTGEYALIQLAVKGKK